MPDYDDQETDHLQRFVLPVGPNVTFALTVVSGPDSGKTILVDGRSPSSVILGQSPASDLRLTDPSVSRRHASLDLAAGGLRVRDLGSTNGTFLNDVRIYEAEARGGEDLSLGGTRLQVRVEDKVVASELPPVDRFGSVLGASASMRRLFPLLERLAKSSIPVLIEGETGTGKEAAAEALHAESPRRDNAFVVFDCTAIAPSLIESELFGHEKGAFTGAQSQRRGVFEQADGGTLFIDELGELSLELQAKLLRAIDTGQVRRVGGDRWLRSDARVVAATRRDLDAMVEEGKFRDDLFHRLAVGRVHLPPLRERSGDVSLLVEHFCALAGAKMSQLRRGVLESWMTHAWPGNVRELRNAVARALALGELSVADPPAARAVERLPAGSAGRELEDLLSALLPYDQSRMRAVEIFQQHYVERALRAANGNAAQAAAAVGIAVRYFHLLRAKSRRVEGG